MPAGTSHPRHAPLLFVTAVGSIAACSHTTAPPLETTATAAQASCAQAPLEDALAFDADSGWFDVWKECDLQNDPSPSSVTSCIQTQLDLLPSAAAKKMSPVLYFRNGTYTLDSTLSITGVNGAILVGEDPAQTVLAWAGPGAKPDPEGLPAPLDGNDPALDVGNMLHIDGSLNVKISRLTFDGAKTAKAAIRVALYAHYTGDKKYRTASTANEYSDLILRDAWYGIRAGIPGGSNDAENTMRRVSFEGLSVAGFSAESQNAMNNAIWSSSFDKCNVGAHAAPASISIYDSTFSGSTKADVRKSSGNGYEIVLQGNTSVGSPTFYQDESGGANLLIQGNRLLTTSSTAIDVAGPLSAIILGNVIQTPPPPSGSSSLPVVVWNSFHVPFPQPANHVTTGNTFSAPQGSAICAFKGGGPDFGNLQDCWDSYLENPLAANLDGGYFYGNTFGTKAQVSLPAAPATPAAKPLIAGGPSRLGPCGDTPGCSDTKNIAGALQFLSQHCTERPILHLRAGIYSITSTIVLPTACPIQIFGDGASQNGTALRWDAPAGAPGADGYMFELPSPAQGVLQDLLIVNAKFYNPNVAAAGRGILVHTDDAADGIVHLNQVTLAAADSDGRPLPPSPRPEDNVAFISKGVDHLNIEAEQTGLNGGDVAVRVVGGGAGAQDMASVSAARFRGVPLSTIYKSQFDVYGHGNLYVSGLDAEGFTHGIRLDEPTASGRFTLATGHLAATVASIWSTSPPDAGKIVVGAFSGDVNLMGLGPINLPVRITAAANAGAQVLGFGLDYRNDWTWERTAAGWFNDPAHGYWNGDAPPSPGGTVCVDPNNPTPDCKWAFPELWAQPVEPAPLYVDCASYRAHNAFDNNNVPVVSYAGVDPTTTPYFPTAKGVYYVEGATSAGHSYFLNDTMWDWDPNDGDPNGYRNTVTRCRDILPPQASPQVVVPVIDAALTEVRKASTAIPHPCTLTTDVRVFRVTYAARQGRTGFAVVGPAPLCTQDSDCTLVRDYDTCQCLSVLTGTPPPQSTAACFVDPCLHDQATCDTGTGACVLSSSAAL